MRRQIQALAFLTGFLWVAPSNLMGADLFQWTDIGGVIHFSDNPYAVPDSLRNSIKLIVHKNFTSDGGGSVGESIDTETVQTTLNNDLTGASEVNNQSESSSLTPDTPQETIIVVVNTEKPHFRRAKACAGPGCKPSFRPVFDKRQPIQPRVFDGSSALSGHPGKNVLIAAQGRVSR